MTDSNPPPDSDNADAAQTAEQQAAAQKAADRHTATRKVYDDISSPYDKLSLNAKERKAYERKVLNIGLALIMIVIAGIGIAAHKLISGIDDVFGDVSVEFQLPETPFSPLPVTPAPAPPPPQPTRMNLPDRTIPTADPARRRVTGRIIGTAGGIDTARGIFEETVIGIRFLIPETGQICSFNATVPPHVAEPQGDTIEVTYDAEAASEDLCASATAVFAPE
jgi:hypothetical protein